MTARAGEALTAAATFSATATADGSGDGGNVNGNGNGHDHDHGDTANRHGATRCGAGGLMVRFSPDNAVGRAWGALGATPWPTDLLEARVLARQLRVRRFLDCY